MGLWPRMSILGIVPMLHSILRFCCSSLLHPYARSCDELAPSPPLPPPRRPFDRPPMGAPPVGMRGPVPGPFPGNRPPFDMRPPMGPPQPVNRPRGPPFYPPVRVRARMCRRDSACPQSTAYMLMSIGPLPRRALGPTRRMAAIAPPMVTGTGTATGTETATGIETGIGIGIGIDMAATTTGIEREIGTMAAGRRICRVTASDRQSGSTDGRSTARPAMGGPRLRSPCEVCIVLYTRATSPADACCPAH
jgi:hypothetical protein